MQKLIKFTVFFGSLVFAIPLVAQNLVIKPYYGYLHLLPQMKDVNNQIARQIEGWREELNELVSFPRKFNGAKFFGAQMQYHLSHGHVLAMDFFFFEESVGTTYEKSTGTLPYLFAYGRRVESFDVVAKLHYYFDYKPAGRFNKYIGLGGGPVFAKAKSFTGIVMREAGFDGERRPVDAQDNFSKTSFTVVISAGADFRLFNFVALWGETGYQYAKVGQIDGTDHRSDDMPNTVFPTEASIDLSGLYFRTGLGIKLPF